MCDDGRYDGRVHAFEFHCDQGATVGGGGTSMILKGCIHQELSAKRSNQNSTFRYEGRRRILKEGQSTTFRLDTAESHASRT
jgi:hypothetical protein